MIHDILLGTDVVDVRRIEQSHQRFGDRLFQKLLTPQELADCHKNPIRLFQRVASRVAIKEAVSKALSIGVNGLGYQQGTNWQEIEVVAHAKQPPQVALRGYAQTIAQRQGVSHWKVSLSHDGDIACATVLGVIVQPSLPEKPDFPYH